jgi:hypothetical protein
MGIGDVLAGVRRPGSKADDLFPSVVEIRD